MTEDEEIEKRRAVSKAEIAEFKRFCDEEVRKIENYQPKKSLNFLVKRIAEEVAKVLDRINKRQKLLTDQVSSIMDQVASLESKLVSLESRIKIDEEKTQFRKGMAS